MNGMIPDKYRKKRSHRCRNGKHRHRHHRHRHARRRRHARSFDHLLEWYSFFGREPPANLSKLSFRKLTRHQWRHDPLSPFVTDFRIKFANYRIPKLSQPCDPIESKLLQTPHDGLSLPEKPSGSSTDDKEVDDFDVLVLGPEVADSLDIKLMTFCRMI